LIKPFIKKSSAVVIGPGLGLHNETIRFVNKIIKIIEKVNIPFLIDADGIKAFAKYKRKLNTSAVLTPHIKEYEILTGKTAPDELEKRSFSCQKTASELGAVILLKSNIDIISNGKNTKVNFTGNPGMTVGGTGDILSGVVGAFLAQGSDIFRASVAGAFVNGAAGDFVSLEKGYHMVATDLLDWIPIIIDNPMCHFEIRRGGVKNQ
jgi:NAD(P)H-hydrate epimerase